MKHNTDIITNVNTDRFIQGRNPKTELTVLYRRLGLIPTAAERAAVADIQMFAPPDILERSETE